jgi:hypothetical protein
MKKERRPPGYWTKERCIEEAKKYNTKGEWTKKSKTSYNLAHRREWLDECSTHMVKNKKPNGYWTKERCIEEAKKYKTRTEWKENSWSSYVISVKNKWSDDCCEHMERIGSLYKRLIYVYIFSDRSVYIGLTLNEKRRKNDHLLCEKKSTVNKYMLKTGLLPKYKKLTDYVPKDDASILEQEYIKRYKKSGFKILNKRKGGGLGGSKLYWTKERCIEEAKKYSTISDWIKNSPSSHNGARKKEWYSECTTHMKRKIKPAGYWTKERCIEESKKYKTNFEWSRKSGTSYGIACKNKWLEECCVHMLKKMKLKGYWTKERCIEDAKKYSTSFEWSRKSGGAYKASRKNKWLDLCFPPKESIKMVA